MASFDFVEAATDGYRFLWTARAFIARLAFIPLFLKVLSLQAVTWLGLEENYLRQGLVLLPAFFAEGWLVAQMIRASVFEEYGIARLTGEAEKDRARWEKRSRCVLSAMVIYVLIKLGVYFVTGLFMAELQQTAGQSPALPAHTDIFAFLIAFLALGIALWGFRFLWLYVPAALGYSVEGFLKKIKGLTSSFYMIALWLMCFVPLMTLLLMILQVFIGNAERMSDLSMANTVLFIVLQSLAETLIVIVSSVAMARAVHSLYISGQSSRKDR